MATITHKKYWHETEVVAFMLNYLGSGWCVGHRVDEDCIHFFFYRENDAPENGWTITLWIIDKTSIDDIILVMDRAKADFEKKNKSWISRLTGL